MEPPAIHYARTTDGVSIACQVLGAGPSLVVPPVTPWSHVQRQWQIPALRDWFTLLSERVSSVHYDGRGTGLSDRAAIDFSLDAQVRDLIAVVDHRQLERFALLGAGSGSPAALAYAATFPGRVTHLVLWCGAARMETSPALRALDALAAHDWRAYTEVVARAGYDWTDEETARAHAAYLRACVDQDVYVRHLPVLRALDATWALTRITAPTLVMMRPDLAQMGLAGARHLVARIAGAQLRVFAGAGFMPGSGDSSDRDAVLAALTAFLAVPQSTRGPDTGPVATALTARELEVLQQLARGQTAGDIARQLGISRATVQRHIANIYAKIGVGGRVEAVTYAYTHGLIAPGRRLST
jgi:DNA-binding CsgD family transcriptional regulator/pimeloyl-ACP methyl ester carboxylesterase